MQTQVSGVAQLANGKRISTVGRTSTYQYDSLILPRDPTTQSLLARVFIVVHHFSIEPPAPLPTGSVSHIAGDAIDCDPDDPYDIEIRTFPTIVVEGFQLFNGYCGSPVFTFKGPVQKKCVDGHSLVVEVGKRPDDFAWKIRCDLRDYPANLADTPIGAQVSFTANFMAVEVNTDSCTPLMSFYPHSFTPDDPDVRFGPARTFLPTSWDQGTFPPFGALTSVSLAAPSTPTSSPPHPVTPTHDAISYPDIVVPSPTTPGALHGLGLPSSSRKHRLEDQAVEIGEGSKKARLSGPSEGGGLDETHQGSEDEWSDEESESDADGSHDEASADGYSDDEDASGEDENVMNGGW